VVDRKQLVVEPIAEPMKSIKMPECGTYRYDESAAYKLEIVDNVEISKSADVATVDADKVKFPLTLRPVSTGDRFVPFGMKGSKLVSDYLTNQKVSLLDKRRQLVLGDASGAIIWLVGRRTDNRFRIDNDTKRTLRITVK
jgi:tRNA(Ile)-lysidine synthase